MQQTMYLCFIDWKMVVALTGKEMSCVVVGMFDDLVGLLSY